MKLLPERGRCQSCGDVTELYVYNNARTCGDCLGMDRRGVSRKEILRRNTGNKNDKSRQDVRRNKRP
jgi:hypothetical protein